MKRVLLGFAIILMIAGYSYSEDRQFYKSKTEKCKYLESKIDLSLNTAILNDDLAFEEFQVCQSKENDKCNYEAMDRYQDIELKIIKEIQDFAIIYSAFCK